MSIARSRTLVERAAALFHSDMHAAKLLLGEMGLIMAIGLISHDYTNSPVEPNLLLMAKIWPLYGWAMLFGAYALLRIHSAVVEEAYRIVQYGTALAGIWVWGCMMLAGITQSAHDTTVYLYAIPIQLEVWCMLQYALWWTKYDADILRVIPGVMLHAPDSAPEQHERPWKDTEVA